MSEAYMRTLSCYEPVENKSEHVLDLEFHQFLWQLLARLFLYVLCHTHCCQLYVYVLKRDLQNYRTAWTKSFRNGEKKDQVCSACGKDTTKELSHELSHDRLPGIRNYLSAALPHRYSFHVAAFRNYWELALLAINDSLDVSLLWQRTLTRGTSHRHLQHIAHSILINSAT